MPGSTDRTPMAGADIRPRRHSAAGRGQAALQREPGIACG